MRSKVFFAFVLSVMASCLSLHAQTVSPEAARAKAMDFFSTGAKNLPARKGAMRKAPAVSNVELAYTSKKDGKTCFYVYNNGTDGGFVIVGGDEVAQEILAYSDHGHFDYDEKNMPENLKAWFSFYNDEINSVKGVRRISPSNIFDESYITYKRVDIPDLITTKWDQGYPYNAAIPTKNPDEHYPTGCTAIAIAQIMNYWKYPQSGIGSKSYTDWYGNELSADFEHTTYDWDNMLDSYDDNFTQSQIDAVSNFSYQVGVALETNYNIQGSSVFFYYDDIVPSGPEATALVETFGYDANILGTGRRHYSTKEWERLIYDELIEGRPVLYASCPDTLVGHDFVIHGYDASTNLFAINWGWGGHADGYYSLSSINSNLQFYLAEDCAQFAYIGIQPPGRERNVVERGDRFESNGLYFKVVSPTHKTVELSYYESQPNSYEPVEIPSTVQYLGEEYVVDRLGKGALKRRDASFSVKYTERDATYWPVYLEITKFPNNLRSIGEEVFWGITVEGLDLSNISHISSNAFNSACIKHIDWPSAVTRIPNHCFQANDVLESITIPEGVLEISTGAFANCKKLKYVELPNTLADIEFGAFKNCSNLTRVEIPESVSFVGMSAFEGCNKVFEFICRSSEPPFNGFQWGSSSFHGIAPNTDVGTLYVPKGSISLYQNAANWKDWLNIKAIEDIPEITHTGETFSVDGIEYQILVDRVVANGLVEDRHDLVIPSFVEHDGISYPVDGIADWAFEHCDISSISIENGCRYIGHGSFSWCPLGGNINIPSSVLEIRELAFSNYDQYPSDLSNMKLSEGLKYIGSEAFRSAKMGKVIVPSSVEEIEGGAFNMSTINTLVVKGGRLKRLDRICSGADSLKHVVLPEDYMNSIWGDEFGGCSHLEDIVLYYCPQSLEELTTRFEYPPFQSDFSKCILYVPEPSVDIYKSSPDWNIFNDIKPIVSLANIAIPENNYSLKPGQTKSIVTIFTPANATVKYCSWTSSDPTIATVDQDGVVTARKSGTVTITATSMYYPDVTATCTVTVKAGTVGTLVDAIDGLPSSRTTLKDVDDAVDSILER